MRTTYINNATVWYYSGPQGVQIDIYASNRDFVQVGDTGNQPEYGGDMALHDPRTIIEIYPYFLENLKTQSFFDLPTHE